MSGALWTTVGRGFRRAALPLVSYYAITLAVPIANGAAQSGAPFVTHAIPVIVVPSVAILLGCGVGYLRARLKTQMQTVRLSLTIETKVVRKGDSLFTRLLR